MRSSTSARMLQQFGLALALITAVAACRPITQTPAAAPATEPPAAVPAQVSVLPPAGKTVQTGDIVTYYEEYGDGEPVILLHGGAQSTVDFASLIPELSKEFKVYALDSRGRGRTTDSIKPLSYGLMMSDTIEFMDVLGIDRAHIVGWSDGAIIGLNMAIHHPERMRSLVSYGGQYDLKGGTPWFFDWLKTATIEDMKEWADGYRAISPHPDRAELVFEKLRAMLLTQPNMTAEQLRTIAVPVLVLDGEDEEFVMIDQTKEMAQLIPGAELNLMKGVGHFAPYQKPEEFNAIVMEYLRRHKGAAASPPVEAKTSPPAGKTVQTGDIVTYYEEYGQGEPVILLHGSFSSAADFAPLIPALAEEFKVYAVDSRGRGRTTDTAKPISYVQMMSDTVAFMDAIGLDKAHVVGVSDGAVIGLDMAIRHPERLKSLVAFGAGWDGTRMAPWYPDWITSVTIDDLDLKDWANAYRAVSPHPERAELVLEKIRAMQLAPKKINADLLKTIPVPVLVMDGENEEFFSLDLPKELAAAVPNAELSLMKGTGHFAMWEKSKEFNTIVMEYLRRH